MKFAALVFLLASAGALAQEAKREVIYGAEMMTRAEREDYRQSLERAKGEEEAAKVRARHREQMQKRARARGETLTESGLLEKPKEKDAK
ncbi:MAG: hypothetical protein EXR31_05580 [Betaproteobacteria bacterium]|nr:hypothetical protein [Betaproteobacteria bacterium]